MIHANLIDATPGLEFGIVLEGLITLQGGDLFLRLLDRAFRWGWLRLDDAAPIRLNGRRALRSTGCRNRRCKVWTAASATPGRGGRRDPRCRFPRSNA